TSWTSPVPISTRAPFNGTEVNYRIFPPTRSSLSLQITLMNILLMPNRSTSHNTSRKGVPDALSQGILDGINCWQLYSGRNPRHPDHGKRRDIFAGFASLMRR